MDPSKTNANFYHLGLSPTMMKMLDRMKIVTPTPIQHKAIPPVLEGEDLVGVAQTGTGKTLAFSIPSIQRLAIMGKGKLLVLVPTRELAMQVLEATKPLLNAFHMSSTVLVGGLPMKRQIQALKKKPRAIVATPGRLIDHLEQKNLNLKDVKVLVLDEADRMLDMGFAPQIDRVVKLTNEDRQTLLFSATMPKSIINMATKYMKLPTHIEIAPEGTAAETVSQELFIVKEENKAKLLGLLLEQYRGSVLLFVRTKIQAKKMKRKVKDLGHSAAEIHSDRSMAQRKQAIEGFKSGRYRVLVATDVAARGIDVDMIELVVNYHLPDDTENYVHRIGRTGRAGDEGHAITFATPTQGSDVARIEKVIRKPLSASEHPEMPQHTFVERSKGAGRRRRRGKGKGKSKNQSKKDFPKKPKKSDVKDKGKKKKKSGRPNFGKSKKK